MYYNPPLERKVILTKFVEPAPRRKDSFWFEGQVAQAILGKVTVRVIAQGHIDVSFNINENNFQNSDAVKEALSRGYTDQKLSNMNKHDGWSNNNWFAFEVEITGGDTYWHNHTSINYDEAMRVAKAIAAEEFEKCNK